jgi:hypothetical protein
MFMPLRLALAELPATSVTVPLTDWFAPSLSVTSTGQAFGVRPLRESEHVKCTVTGPLYHPFEFGLVLAAAVMLGGVLSTLIVTDLDALSPAPLVAEHVITVPAVSLVRVTLSQPVDDAIPDSGSVTLQVTVTVELFQPP